MKCLVISDTFPNRLEPWRGFYNRRQIECLAGLCTVAVINPVPWTRLLSGTGFWNLVSRPDHLLESIVIYHPVCWYAPGIARSFTWRSVLAASRRVLAENKPGYYDVILATFAYPHGLAAKYLSRDMGVPYVVKVRGSDLHSLPSSGARREKTAEALRDAAAILAVSRNLADIAVELGAQPDRIYVLPNGVDANSFTVVPRKQARKWLGLKQNGKLVLFVGNLLPVKGLDVLVEALCLNSKRSGRGKELRVAIAGNGPMHRWAEKRVARCSPKGSVRFLGRVSRQDVALWMNAADALVLPSRNEGCPNVVLEALCCGTPVVASRVGAVPELLDEICGVLVEPGNSEDLARALRLVLQKEWDRAALRRRVERMSWQQNAHRLYKILRGVASFTHGLGHST